MSVWSAKWSVQESYVISAWSATSSVHDSYVSSAYNYVIRAWLFTWLLPAEQHDSSQLSSMIFACWLFYLCLLSSLIIVSRGTWSLYDSKHDQRMIIHMISAIKSRDQYMIVMWSVHAQSRYQCMISHVISAWSVTWLVYDHPRDQCMGSHVISAWYRRDQCMISLVISAW